MPAGRVEMATQSAQSLPSFAQAFSGPSLNRISTTNALPPIHRRPSPNPLRRSPSDHGSRRPSLEPRQTARKRLHDLQGNDESSESDGRRSPRTVRIKEEAEYDSLPSVPQPRLSQSLESTDAANDGPSASMRPSPSKKRRVTISGMAHHINTDVRTPPENISPVVMGIPFNMMLEDPAALEQMRSMLTVKQKQKELIEQRRGSTASIISTAPPSVNVVNPLTSDERHLTPKTTKAGRRLSPNVPAGIDRRRSIAVISTARQFSPNPPVVPSHPVVPSQQPAPPSAPPPAPDPPQAFVHTTTAATPAHALPAPPISFARRRAGRQLGGAKGKPADIVISPRDPQADNLQPMVQSAPPIPRAEHGHGQNSGGRFTNMMLPSLPSLGSTTPRQTASRVPPTPTRLNMPRNSGQPSGRSPHNASVPIASTLVPATPATFHRPGYSGEKSAFLAPFEMFYDALADSRQLKSWLGEQLQKSQALTASLQRQQEQMDEIVNAAVEKKVATMREEVYTLHRRIEELEHTVRAPRGAPYTYSPSAGAGKGKAKANGVPSMPLAPETYTFPPVEPTLRRPEPTRRMPSPMQLDKDSDSRSFAGSQTASPVPFDVGRRLSVSAVRHDPRVPASGVAEVRRPSVPAYPPSQGARERELQAHGYPQPGAHAGKSGWSPMGGKAGLPPPPTSSTRSSLGHAHPVEAPGIGRRPSFQRLPAEYPYREGHASSESSGEGRLEGPGAPGRRDSVVGEPPRNRARSPIDDG